MFAAHQIKDVYYTTYIYYVNCWEFHKFDEMHGRMAAQVFDNNILYLSIGK
jgi:hypothetical protein